MNMRTIPPNETFSKPTESALDEDTATLATSAKSAASANIEE
jgi:hypothetical protein